MAAAHGYHASEASTCDFILTAWNVLDCNLEHTVSAVSNFVDILKGEAMK
jgi:hypothetical protein